MKFKNAITTLAIVASLIGSSQSAFAAEAVEATEQAITPFAAGVGDTKNSAITLFGDQDVDLYLSSINDQDWFKWTNNTGQDKLVAGYLQPKGSKSDFKFALEITYPSGKTSSQLVARDIGPGNSQVLENIYIPAGGTAYFLVGSDRYEMEQYSFWFRLYDL